MVRKKQKPTCFIIAGHSHINLLKKLRQDGWKIVLFFLWIPDAAFSKRRIRERVKHGGHNIPDETIYRRFPRIMHNLIKTYILLCDKVLCYDNSKPKYAPVFEKSGKDLSIFDQNIYERIIGQSNEYKKTQ